MSYRHTNRRKTQVAARDLLTVGCTAAQLDRLLSWQAVSVRVYDRLINPLLSQSVGKRRPGDPRRTIRSQVLARDSFGS